MGKSSLLRRMNAEPFIPDYIPTRFMQATEIYWHPISRQSETVRITVWDVVDKAIQPNTEVKRTKELPDASTVDTMSRADGVIVVYDPRNEDSIYYALDVIDQTPENMPLLVLANFSDELANPSEVHPLMQECSLKRFHLAASMKTNIGLAELATWLDLPLNTSLAKMYKLHLDESEAVLKQLMDEFHQTGFTDPAAAKIPSLTRSETPTTDGFFNDESESKEMAKHSSTENFAMIPTLNEPMNEAAFFSDDDNEEDLDAFLKAHPNAKINLDVLKPEEEDEDETEKRKKKTKILAKRKEQSISEPEQSVEEAPKPAVTTPPIQQIVIPVIEEQETGGGFFSDDDSNNNDDLEAFMNAHPDAHVNLDVLKDDDDELPQKKSKIISKASQPAVISKPKPEVVTVSEPEPEVVAVSEPEPEVAAVPEPEPNAIPTIVMDEDTKFFDNNDQNDFFGDEEQETTTAKEPQVEVKPEVPTLTGFGDEDGGFFDDDDEEMPEIVMKEMPKLDIPVISNDFFKKDTAPELKEPEVAEIPTLSKPTEDSFFEEPASSNEFELPQITKPLPALITPDYSLPSSLSLSSNPVKVTPLSDLDIIGAGTATTSMRSEYDDYSAIMAAAQQPQQPSGSSAYESFGDYEGFSEMPSSSRRKGGKRHGHSGRSHKSRHSKKTEQAVPEETAEAAEDQEAPGEDDEVW